MTDIENATKAAQCASLLCADLQALAKSDNLLLADLALHHLETTAKLRISLERIHANLQLQQPAA